MGRSADVSKSDLFRQLGYGGDQDVYEAALEEAGLSRRGKQRISEEKREQVKQLLETMFARVCQRVDCQAVAQERSGGRQVVPSAAPGDCEICAGSVNAMQVAEMVKACQRVGWRRLCVVGGSPSSAAELASLIGTQLELRVVQGTTARTRRDAEADLAWADRVVIWGSTELAHKVSALYKGPHVITVARRGIAELARGVTESATRQG